MPSYLSSMHVSNPAPMGVPIRTMALTKKASYGAVPGPGSMPIDPVSPKFPGQGRPVRPKTLPPGRWPIDPIRRRWFR
jgi:hypothetical protein